MLNRWIHGTVPYFNTILLICEILDISCYDVTEEDAEMEADEMEETPIVVKKAKKKKKKAKRVEEPDVSDVSGDFGDIEGYDEGQEEDE